ncbi:endonuclease domain-containing 1 protein-like [Rhincodon typus]|uniref:endonuclease domain-containing 1 protein-like n=1 Tax=Rhincodon typus TaxID=259920 RepID=UPI0009A3DCB4|nr:endonuclease domain-containing 1 protein-like [Rhincodon typus]
MGTGSLVLFLLLAGLVRGEVVQDFDKCSWFFQGGIPPRGFESQNWIKICQRYKNHYHYATLYNSGLRVPVYSAYRYPCTMGQSAGYRPKPWFYEPQIDDPAEASEMKSCTVPSSAFQAVESDYKNEKYERGHLYPFKLNDKESATSTCTLTNAVPESHRANVRWFHQVESLVQKLAQKCHQSKQTMYVVTGAAKPTQMKMNNRVSVPGLVWTALCCTFPQDPNNDPCPSRNVVSEETDTPTYNKDFSFAFMKNMEPEADAEHLTVREVQERLGVGKIFDTCRGTTKDDEAETFKEVEALVSKLATITDDQEDNSLPIPAEENPTADSDDLATQQTDAPLEPASKEVDKVCQSTITNALAPIGRMITLVTNGISAFARLITTVINIARILMVTILRVPMGIIHDCAGCLTIMVKYLIVMVATVPQDILGIVASIVSDTVGIIAWSARLIKYLVRIL